jgi:hypothetical protein
MPKHLLTEASGLLALPSFPIALQGRDTEGLFWDPQHKEVVIEALPAITTPPLRSELKLDESALTATLQSLGNEETMENTAIFGGYLLRHFGHFVHESLSRLWWLGKTKSDAMEDDLVNGARRRLQSEEMTVVFFMPRWLDCEKDLPAYMAELLTGLGLPTERIHILVGPTRFRRLLIPAQCWGFDFNQADWNSHLGCDCRGLMRTMLGSYNVLLAPTSVNGGLQPSEKLYITRTGLPLQLGRLLGDVLLDRLMEAAGFQIFHPERHPIAEQIRQYSLARELVFMDGSALYLLWFCQLQPGVRIKVILRRRQGAWMCNQIKILIPVTAGIRWQPLNALLAEGLTSKKDWESHNLANLSSLARQLAPKTFLSREQIRATVSTYVEELVKNSNETQLSEILKVLLSELLPSAETMPRGTLSRLGRLGRRLRRSIGLLATRMKCPGFTSP